MTEPTFWVSALAVMIGFMMIVNQIDDWQLTRVRRKRMAASRTAGESSNE